MIKKIFHKAATLFALPKKNTLKFSEIDYLEEDKYFSILRNRVILYGFAFGWVYNFLFLDLEWKHFIVGSFIFVAAFNLSRLAGHSLFNSTMLRHKIFLWERYACLHLLLFVFIYWRELDNHESFGFLYMTIPLYAGRLLNLWQRLDEAIIAENNLNNLSAELTPSSDTQKLGE